MPDQKPLEEQIVKGQPIQLRQTIELQFQGDTLKNLQEQNQQFNKINLTESAGSKNSQRKLLVTVEGIHAGMTKNLTFYPGTTLESSVPSWTSPHRKPVLKNHNVHTEPLGRIANAEYVKSTLNDSYTVRQTLELTDQDAIDKVLDGRYLTLSVGGSANQVNCSICMKNLVEEGWCGHSRGRKYEGKTAHWVIGQYTGDEISFVNMPADVHSQVIACELVQGEGGKGVSKEANTNPTGASVGESSELDLLDGILGEKAPAGENPAADPGQPNENNDHPGDPKEGQENPEGGENPGQPNESNENPPTGEETLEEKVARLEKEVSEKDQKILDLTKQVEQTDADNLTLSADLSESQLKVKSLESQVSEKDQTIATLTDEKNTFVEQNLKLAKFARKSMAERVADLRIIQGKSQADERDALIAEWSQSSAKVLESTIQDLLKNSQRPIATVTNPGMAVQDKNSIAVDDNGNEVKVKESKKKTLADMEQTMVKYMSRDNY